MFPEDDYQRYIQDTDAAPSISFLQAQSVLFPNLVLMMNSRILNNSLIIVLVGLVKCIVKKKFLLYYVFVEEMTLRKHQKIITST